MPTRPVRPVALRSGVEIADPVDVVRGYLEAWRFEPGDLSASFAKSDLRLANRGGARISAAEIASVLERRRAIQRALREIPAHASLAVGTRSVPWPALTSLFDAFAGIRGVGVSKTTKALHPKRPALIPMLDSVVQRYLHAFVVGGEKADEWDHERAGIELLGAVGLGERALRLTPAVLEHLRPNLVPQCDPTVDRPVPAKFVMFSRTT